MSLITPGSFIMKSQFPAPIKKSRIFKIFVASLAPSSGFAVSYVVKSMCPCFLTWRGVSFSCIAVKSCTCIFVLPLALRWISLNLCVR